MIDKILNPNTKVGDIFPNDVAQAKNIYRDLCKKNIIQILLQMIEQMI